VNKELCYLIGSDPEFPSNYPGNPSVYFWIDLRTGEKHGYFQFRSGAEFDAHQVLGADAKEVK
jgi:hypothetical protein